MEVTMPRPAAMGTVCSMNWKCLLGSYSLGFKFRLSLGDHHLSPGPKEEPPLQVWLTLNLPSPPLATPGCQPDNFFELQI